MATVIYWSSASFPTIQSGCVTRAEGLKSLRVEAAGKKRRQTFRSFIQTVWRRPLAAMMPFPLVRL